MKFYGFAISTDAPSKRDVLWAKPVGDGFTLYILDAGTWKPLKLVDDKGTNSTADDQAEPGSALIYEAIVGTNEDTGTEDTINGAKAYATGAAADAAAGAVNTITGTVSDTSEDLTLYGLKAYIDSKTNSGGGGGSDQAL